MKKHLIKKTSIILALLGASAYANAEHSRKFYIGVEYGATLPLSKKFKIDDVDVKAHTDRVKGFRLGYQFYPDFYLDFSFADRHGIEMKASMDDKDPAYGPYNVSGSAKFTYQSYILSLKYTMPRDQKYTPYLTAGIGVAKIGVNKQRDLKLKLPAANFDDYSGIVKKKSKITPAIRLAAGIDTEVSEFLSLYVDGRVEITKKVPVDFTVYRPGTNNTVEFAKKRVKTRMGVAEAVLGLKISL